MQNRGDTCPIAVRFSASPSQFYHNRHIFTLPSDIHDCHPCLATALTFTARPIRPPCPHARSCSMVETPSRVRLVPRVHPTASTRTARLATLKNASPGSPNGDPVGEQYLAELDVELIQSEASDEEVNALHYAPKPAPCETSGVSPTSSNGKLDEHRKMRNRAWQAKYRRIRGEHVAAANGDADKKFTIRALTTVNSSRGGAVHYIRSGDTYLSNAEGIHRSR